MKISKMKMIKSAKKKAEKYNKSIAQYIRHHGTTTVGSDVRKVPYFKIENSLRELKDITPSQNEKIIDSFGRKIHKATTLKKQNQLFGNLNRILFTQTRKIQRR